MRTAALRTTRTPAPASTATSRVLRVRGGAATRAVRSRGRRPRRAARGASSRSGMSAAAPSASAARGAGPSPPSSSAAACSNQPSSLSASAPDARPRSSWAKKVSRPSLTSLNRSRVPKPDNRAHARRATRLDRAVQTWVSELAAPGEPLSSARRAADVSAALGAGLRDDPRAGTDGDAGCPAARAPAEREGDGELVVADRRDARAMREGALVAGLGAPADSDSPGACDRAGHAQLALLDHGGDLRLQRPGRGCRSGRGRGRRWRRGRLRVSDLDDG